MNILINYTPLNTWQCERNLYSIYFLSFLFLCWNVYFHWDEISEYLFISREEEIQFGWDFSPLHCSTNSHRWACGATNFLSSHLWFTLFAAVFSTDVEIIVCLLQIQYAISVSKCESLQIIHNLLMSSSHSFLAHQSLCHKFPLPCLTLCCFGYINIGPCFDLCLVLVPVLSVVFP